LSLLSRLPVALLAILLIVVAPSGEKRFSAALAGQTVNGRVGADVPVTAVDLRLAAAKNSPAIAADPTDARFVVAAYKVDAPQLSCGMEISIDGGRGWTVSNPVPRLPKGAERCYAPEVAFDRAGRLYYLFAGLHTLGNVPMGIFLSTSDDHGRTFSSPRRVLGPNAFGARMAIDTPVGSRGRIHITWLQANTDPPIGGLPAPPNPILAAFSDDGGKRFSAPVVVSAPARPHAVAPALTLGPKHEVYVAYYDLGDDRIDYHGLEGETWGDAWSLVLSASLDGGRSFGPTHVVDDQIAPPERVLLVLTMPPASLVADSRGTLYVGWYDARNGDWDVFMRRSIDHGSTWEAPIRLNDDAVGNGRHQYLPRLAASPGGRVDAVFYDRRDDPANVRNHVSFTSSSDAGKTFSPSVRVSTENFDTFVGGRYAIPSARGLVEFGSRLALLSTDRAAVMAWTDTRNSFGTGDKVAGPTPQDIYAAEIDFGP
jgi:hypothetical protein